MYHGLPFDAVPVGSGAQVHVPFPPLPLVHCGSAQSTSPSQLSSIPLSQISSTAQHWPLLVCPLAIIVHCWPEPHAAQD